LLCITVYWWVGQSSSSQRLVTIDEYDTNHEHEVRES
jgi:hypothetical protein